MFQMLEFHKCVYLVLCEYVQYHSGVWIFVLDAPKAIYTMLRCTILHVL